MTITELPTATVLTVMFDQGEHSLYARTSEEIDALIDQVLAENTEYNRTTIVCAWDRPARSHRDEDTSLFPPTYLRVASHPPTGWAAMTWNGHEEVLDTYNPDDPSDAPALVFACDGPDFLPASASLPIEQVRRALNEHATTGDRPTCVQWQQGYLVL